MEALTCDVCGGTLSVVAGGEFAVCEYCGMKHSIERMREKVQEIKGTVNITGDVSVTQTGTSADVQKWRKLLDDYMEACDYKAALDTVRKILEAVPENAEAKKKYDDLQEFQYLDVRNGVLVKYTGKAVELNLPEGIKEIGSEAFSDSRHEKLFLPNSLTDIHGRLFGDRFGVKQIKFGKKLKKIGDGTCNDVYEEICIPENVEYIGKNNFTEDKEIYIPESVEYIGAGSFTSVRKICIPESVKFIGDHSFCQAEEITFLGNYDGPFEWLDDNRNVKTITANDNVVEKIKDHMHEKYRGWINQYIRFVSRRKELMKMDPYSRIHYGIGGLECMPLRKRYLSYTSPWERKIEPWLEQTQKTWRSRCVCQNCGGKFVGFFNPICETCEMPKDY